MADQRAGQQPLGNGHCRAWARAGEGLQPQPTVLFFFFFFFRFPFRAALEYGSSQARGQIGDAAGSLRHGHGNARSELPL